MSLRRDDELFGRSLDRLPAKITSVQRESFQPDFNNKILAYIASFTSFATLIADCSAPCIQP